MNPLHLAGIYLSVLVSSLSADVLPDAGFVLRTNGQRALILTDYGTTTCRLSEVSKIAPLERLKQNRGTNGLPVFREVLLTLSREPWAAALSQIPATVIDTGVMRNVPYVSMRCGEDFEVNIYGDLDNPAAIEAGAYRQGASNNSARAQCLTFIRSLLPEATQRLALDRLDENGQTTNVKSLTLETTPPIAPDAYGGWWISVYSAAGVEAARLSASELADVTTGPQSAAEDAWSAADMKQARKVRPTKIAVKTSSGYEIPEAEIVRVNEGVSLVWRSGAMSGVARLADLPPEMQAAFGYDPVKSDAATEAERKRRIREWQESEQARSLAAAAQAAAPRREVITPVYSPAYTYSYTPSSRTSGGSVYVRGYTRKDGSYVRAHTRSSSGRRR